jgi:hypothetical protein
MPTDRTESLAAPLSQRAKLKSGGILARRRVGGPATIDLRKLWPDGAEELSRSLGIPHALLSFRLPARPVT